jgi:hypothetical protein
MLIAMRSFFQKFRGEKQKSHGVACGGLEDQGCRSWVVGRLSSHASIDVSGWFILGCDLVMSWKFAAPVCRNSA